jgi:hypothetical protein
MQDAVNLEQLRGSWEANPVATGVVAAATSGLTDVQATTMGLITQLPSLPGKLVSALLKIKTHADSIAVRDALRFIRGVNAYGTDIVNTGEGIPTEGHSDLLKAFAADIPTVGDATTPTTSSISAQQLEAAAECLAQDSSVDHRIILPPVTQEPPVDTTAEDEEIALLVYEQLTKGC